MKKTVVLFSILSVAAWFGLTAFEEKTQDEIIKERVAEKVKAFEAEKRTECETKAMGAAVAGADTLYSKWMSDVQKGAKPKKPAAKPAAKPSTPDNKPAGTNPTPPANEPVKPANPTNPKEDKLNGKPGAGGNTGAKDDKLNNKQPDPSKPAGGNKGDKGDKMKGQ